MKKLLVPLVIVIAFAPITTTLIRCSVIIDEDFGGETDDVRKYVNWSEDVTITSELEGKAPPWSDNINYPEGGIKAETHKIGNWVEGTYGPVWEPIMYNFHFKLDSYQMKSYYRDDQNSPAEAEALYNEPFTADIPAYFDKDGVFKLQPTQIKPKNSSTIPYLKWTGQTSNSNILYTTNGEYLWFLNTNGQGMSFKGNGSGNVQGLTLSVGDTYSGLIGYNRGFANVTKDQYSKYTNVPLMKENRIYSVYNSKYSFTVSRPSINQDK